MPGFRRRSTEIFKRLRQLSCEVLEALVMGMTGSEEEHAAAVQAHSGPVGQLRFLHYPSMHIHERVLEEAKRLPAHTDWRYALIL